MFDSLRFSHVKLNIFPTLAFTLIVLVIILASLYIDVSENGKSYHHHHHHRHHHYNQIQTHHQTTVELKIISEERIVPPRNTLKPQDLDLLVTSPGSATRFDSRVREFFSSNMCRTRVFMTWISPADLFGEREMFGLESLFQTNPRSCLVILSKTMDSEMGRRILDPLVSVGFQAQSVSPDLWALLKNTPAENWLIDIKNGKRDPGSIPLGQNLSNLIRLAALYKYGGVYLDTDFILLRDISGLRNSIGSQSVDVSGNWTRLNNALLIFEREHIIVYKFLEEFALSFDGNKWGHNGPYLVSRVVNSLGRIRGCDFTVLPPTAFYPVDWTRVAGFFVRPNDRSGERWVGAKIRQLNRSSYGVHLWNRQSRRFKIEEGSVVERLVSAHCVVTCSRSDSSQLTT
ncbi:hypothetical protein OROHE_013295 [Orobanche hederae]